jgi:fatty acid/phospholipid biosynthesis enzyme
MTRAFVALAHGRVEAAFAASPAGALLAAGGWGLAAAALARPALGFAWPTLSARTSRALAIAAVGVLLLNWVYLLAAGARA